VIDWLADSALESWSRDRVSPSASWFCAALTLYLDLYLGRRVGVLPQAREGN
jgi:hypothetical protein